MSLLLIVIVTLIIGQASLSVWANVLNASRISPAIPKEFEGWYDAEKYKRSQEYLSENTKLKIISQSIKTAIVCLFYAFGGFGLIDSFSRAHSGGSELISSVVFVSLLVILVKLLDLPFSIYHTFVTEQRFGFNKMSPLTFFGDTLKELLLTAVLGIPIFLAIVHFFAVAGEHAWLYCWVFYTAFELLVMYAAPVVIMPLFNKFTPLADGELKTKIDAYAKENSFALSGVFVMDGSKRSARANAFFTGFGRFRKIALFDTLIAQHSADELLAVLAHEVGHFKKRHIFRLQFFSILLTGAMLYALGIIMQYPALYEAFSVKTLSLYTGIVLGVIVLSPFNMCLGIAGNLLSRRYEFEADAFSIQTAKINKDVFIDALKRLTVSNLSNLTPHPLKVLLEYTHPPVLERIARIRSEQIKTVSI